MIDGEPTGIRSGSWWRRWRATTRLVAAALIVASIAARLASGVDVPKVRGHQLFFFFDARPYDSPDAGLPARVTFVTILNPATETVAVEVVAYDQRLAPIVAETLEIPSGQRVVLDLPSRYAEEHEEILTAGLLVVTPVMSADDPRPIVPPSELAGSFTVAGPYNGFGENAFGRSVIGESKPGDVVDGRAVKYEPIGPTSGIVAISGYFDLDQLGDPDQDGNRVVLVAFEDRYEEMQPFRIAAPDPAVGVAPTFCSTSGVVAAQPTPVVGGVYLTDLRAIGGDTTPTRGSVFFAFDARPDLNVFGVFSQALEHLGAGQRMPALGRVPPCETPALTPTATPTPTESPRPVVTPVPAPTCGNDIVEPSAGEQCDGEDVACFDLVGGNDEASCPARAPCVDCRYDVSACAACACDADSDCNLEIDCSAIRPGCVSVTACVDGVCLSEPPGEDLLQQICTGPRWENRRVPRCE